MGKRKRSGREVSVETLYRNRRSSPILAQNISQVGHKCKPTDQPGLRLGTRAKEKGQDELSVEALYWNSRGERKRNPFCRNRFTLVALAQASRVIERTRFIYNGSTLTAGVYAESKYPNSRVFPHSHTLALGNDPADSSQGRKPDCAVSFGIHANLRM
jgi:hypothetical protein